MRRLHLLLALLPALLLPPPARALPATIEILSPTSPVGIDTPFTIDVRRTGTWVLDALQEKARENTTAYAAWMDAWVDGVRVAKLWLALGVLTPSGATYEWAYPAAWRITIPALPSGLHELTVSYAGDGINMPDPASWSFALFTPPPILPSLVPSPADPFPTPFDPILQPTGIVVLSDVATDLIQWRDIRSILIGNAAGGGLSLDLSWLTGETLVSYTGDANFPGFNFSYTPPDAEAVPAPVAPLPLALLALALLRLRPRPAKLCARLRGSPCRTPISFTCASIPATR